MALDFSVLEIEAGNRYGKPLDHAALSVELHGRILVQAQKDRLEFFQSITDYYRDYEVVYGMLDRLLSELEVLKRSIPSQEMLQFANNLRRVIALAMTRNTSLHVIAD